MRPRLAASVALRIASGTSRAFPWPKPTRPFSSPTTTSAAKPKRRPPFTTFAPRLMWTSLSTNSLSRSSRSRRSRRSRGSRAMILPHLSLAAAAVRGANPHLDACHLRSSRLRLSEIESALARRIGQRLDATVQTVTDAMERNVLDALRGCALGALFAHRFRRFDIGARFEAAAHLLVQRGGGHNGLAVRIVDQLRINMFGRPEDREPRPVAGGAADLASDFRRPSLRPIRDCGHRALSLLLAFFAEDILARVLDPLALVRLGLAEGADYGGDMANFLFIDAGDHNLGGPGHRDRNAFRDRIDDVVAVAELDLQVLALQGGAIADAIDLEAALEPFGHARYRVGKQRTVRSPHGAGALGIGARSDFDLTALHRCRYVAAQPGGNRTPRRLFLDRPEDRNSQSVVHTR